ncbi:REPEAT-CONTAINING PROTEIN putative-RELATED [Salix koriyanagi]|uniref:REPEAT-CONTAINING PROTEIN putative-RELATED n=1 Tax=Salix koriyanagi TaxID=2511006 RepID=A0A9Q0U3A7_9ROSI|nr:REPEAT-CONTAINING PROTEIN putative-RELATED [Salix koriyanagi]
MKKSKFPADELELALERVSTPNKTVIIAVVNQAYVEQIAGAETTMLDLFLESFWLGEDTRPLLDHLLLVSVDQIANEMCIFKRLNCYKVETEGVDFGKEQIFMSRDFISMMWRRTLLLLDILKHGYNFIFTDVDVMWLRNPLSRLSIHNESVDLEMSTGHFNGDPRSEKNPINTGFYYIRSNSKTVSLFDAWYGRKDNSTGKKEQDVFFELMDEGMLGRQGLHARFLDTAFFSGFCEDSRDIEAVITVHANCCRSINAKIKDLNAVLRDWKKYKATRAEAASARGDVTVPFRWTGQFGCLDSWNNNV